MALPVAALAPRARAVMGFASPWLLLALASIAVPVLVHLIERETRSGRGFPSLMFLERVPFETRRQRRLRDLALLALRCLALAALVLAFAGPQLSARPHVATDASARDVVLLLDRSYSMAGDERWPQARRLALEQVDALGPADRLALIAFDDETQLLTSFAEPPAAARSRIAGLEPGEGGTRIAAALGLAGQLLAEGGRSRRVVVLVSDLQRSALNREAALRVDEPAELRVVAVDAAVAANAAVLGAELGPPRAEGVDDELRVRIGNTGTETLADVRVTLEVEGHPVDSRSGIALGPGEERVLAMPVVLAADRPTRVRIALGPDEMPGDDVFHLALDARRPVPVALAQPARPRPHHGVFLEEALALARAPGVKLARVGVSDLSDDVLARHAVLVLDDVPLPEGAAAEAVADFVARGGGVLAALGPDTGRWPAAARTVLPGRIGDPRAFDAAGVRRALAALGVDDGPPWHPLWSAAGVDPALLFASARVSMARALEPERDDRVLARLDDGTPLLLERVTGASRALAIATTLDPRWSSLVLEPGFVPLVQGAVTLLAGRAGAPAQVRTGEVVELATQSARLADSGPWRRHFDAGGAAVVEQPDGRSERLRGGRTAFRARHPGIVEIHRSGADGETLPVAVNVDRRESLLEALAVRDFEARVERRAALPAARDALDDAGAKRRRHVAWWLLVAAGLLFAAEGLLANLMAARRRAGTRGDGGAPASDLAAAAGARRQGA